MVSLLALRARTLTRSGAAAGAVIGTIGITAGWSWGALLLSVFISVSLLSRLGAAQKARTLTDLLQKGGARDSAQIIANGAVFTIAAVGSLIAPAPAWYALAAGALAFSAADTWATEIGTLAREAPRSIISGRKVPTGTSGGVSLVGTLGAGAGALFIAAEAALAAWPVSFTAALLGGVVAAMTDSIIGATLQARRWCPRCNRPTERTVHVCGTVTTVNAGIRWLDNDMVNALCSTVGALITLVLQ